MLNNNHAEYTGQSDQNVNSKRCCYRAIFFDLDGTILPMDVDEFMEKYVAALIRFVVFHGLDVDVFRKGLFGGVQAMASHAGEQSNAAVFWDVFFDLVLGNRDIWIPLFEQFYENEFNAVGKDVVANPYAAESIKVLQEKGYPLLLATQPMFPLQATKCRIAWANVETHAFCRITHFENSTSVKPKCAYYEENLQAAKLKPHEVLMVGNDTHDDLVCLELGMDAYLITDFLINRNNYDLSTVKHGSFGDFLAWAKSLPPCANPATDVEQGLIGL